MELHISSRMPSDVGMRPYLLKQLIASVRRYILTFLSIPREISPNYVTASALLIPDCDNRPEEA